MGKQFKSTLVEKLANSVQWIIVATLNSKQLHHRFRQFSTGLWATSIVCIGLITPPQIAYALPATLDVSGIANSYAEVNAISGDVVTIGALSASGSQTPFAVDDWVLLIQMTGPPPGHGGSLGVYEKTQITSISNQDITLTAISRTYQATTEAVQLVRIPAADTVSVVADITAQNWNGTTGGVIALKGDTLNLWNDIDATTAGFSAGTSTTRDWNGSNIPPTYTAGFHANSGIQTSLSTGIGGFSDGSHGFPAATYYLAAGRGGGGMIGGAGGAGGIDTASGGTSGGTGGGIGEGGQGGGGWSKSPGVNGGRGHHGNNSGRSGSGGGGGGGINGGGGGGGGGAVIGGGGGGGGMNGGGGGGGGSDYGTPNSGGGGGGSGSVGSGANASCLDSCGGSGGGSYGGGGGGASAIGGGNFGSGGGTAGGIAGQTLSYTAGGAGGSEGGGGGGSAHHSFSNSGHPSEDSITHFFKPSNARLMMGESGGSSVCQQGGAGGGIIILDFNEVNMNNNPTSTPGPNGPPLPSSGSDAKILSTGQTLTAAPNTCAALRVGATNITSDNYGAGGAGGGAGGQMRLTVEHWIGVTNPNDGSSSHIWISVKGGNGATGAGAGGQYAHTGVTGAGGGAGGIWFDDTQPGVASTPSVTTTFEVPVGVFAIAFLGQPSTNGIQAFGGQGGVGFVQHSDGSSGTNTGNSNCIVNATVTVNSCVNGGADIDPNNDTYTVTLTVSGTDTDTSFSYVSSPGGVSNSSVDYSASPYVTAPILINSQSSPLSFTITDDANSSCQATSNTINEPATCSDDVAAGMIDLELQTRAEKVY